MRGSYYHILFTLDSVNKGVLTNLPVYRGKNILQIILTILRAFFCSWEKKKPLKFLMCWSFPGKFSSDILNAGEQEYDFCESVI